MGRGWLAAHRRANPIDLQTVYPNAKKDNAAEQDHAAGGRDNRWLTRSDGTVVLAKIRVRLRRTSRRAEMTLRWAPAPQDPRHGHWVGSTEARNRTEALREGWREVAARKLLTPEGRARDIEQRRKG